MSEEKKYSLTEYVFRDIRVIENSKYYYIKEVNDALAVITDPLERVLKYQEICKENDDTPDAERWSIALNSYKEYKCFQNDNYSIVGSCLYYSTNDKKRIRITADTLTGPSEIINPIPEDVLSNNIELKAALDEFCSVAYTVGNVCPLMDNKGGSTGSDTCWYKLANHIKMDAEYDSIKEIPQHFNNDSRIYNNLNVRHLLSYNPKQKKQTEPPYYYALFGVFPERLSGKETINNLMLKDYYDDNYNLIINKTPKEHYDLGVDEYIKFIRRVTTLIIKRGIRIYNALPDNMKKTE